MADLGPAGIFGGGGGGATAQADPQDPQALLQQIRQLLDQYLALGPDTPVASEAQILADAIDTGGGGTGEQTAPPGGEPQQPETDLGGMGMLGEEGAMGGNPDLNLPPNAPGGNEGGAPRAEARNVQAGAESSGPTQNEPPPSKARSFKEANVSAKERLKKRNKK